jgi:Kef-type K+ transport system membrane component KefB
MIVACIGYNRVLSNREIYLILVIMSMMTTLFTPLVYRNWLFRKEKN